MRGFRRINTSGDLSKVQDNVDAYVSQLEAVPFLDGKLLEGVAFLSGSDTQVTHALGHSLAGYWVVSKTGPADFYLSPTASPQPTRWAYLRSTAAVTASLWVF